MRCNRTHYLHLNQRPKQELEQNTTTNRAEQAQTIVLTPSLIVELPSSMSPQESIMDIAMWIGHARGQHQSRWSTSGAHQNQIKDNDNEVSIITAQALCTVSVVANCCITVSNASTWQFPSSFSVRWRTLCWLKRQDNCSSTDTCASIRNLE